MGRFKALHGDCQKLGVRGHSCHLLPILEALQLPRSECSRILKICDHFDLFALFVGELFVFVPRMVSKVHQLGVC